jgi:hypothetical protein
VGLCFVVAGYVLRDSKRRNVHAGLSVPRGWRCLLTRARVCLPQSSKNAHLQQCFCIRFFLVLANGLAEFTATSQVKHSSQRIRSSDDVDIATRNRLEADGLYSSEAFAQRAVTVVNAHASEENGQPQQPLFLFMPFTAPHTPTQVCTHLPFVIVVNNGPCQWS